MGGTSFGFEAAIGTGFMRPSWHHATKLGTATVAGKPSETLPPMTEKSILGQAGIRRKK